MEKHSNSRHFIRKERLIRQGLVILLSLFPVFSVFGQGYELKVKIPALKDAPVILGHHFGDMYYPDDTVKLDGKGIGTFHKSNTLPQGMYFIYLPNKKVFDILMGQDQVFSIEVDTTDFVNTAKITGSVENDLFFNHMKYMAKEVEKANILKTRKEKAANELTRDSVTKALDKLNKEVTGYLDKTIADNKGLLFSRFLNATQDIIVPDPPRDASGKTTDTTFQYRYYRQHYFDHMDYCDPSLLRTPVYEKKVKDYVEKVIPQVPDTLCKEIDHILDKAKPNDEVFRFLLVTFFNMYAQSQIMGFDAIFIHIAEKYYIPYATWAEKDYMDKLKKEINRRKPTLLGNIAPNIKLVEVSNDHFLAAKTDTALKSNPYVGSYLNLHDVKARFTVLIFWDADCGHCKHMVPELHTIYQDLKSLDVKVVAVHNVPSVEGKRKWIDFVNEHELYDWINVWSPYSLDYREIYDVFSTPVILILDANKKILAKKIAPDQVKDIIDFELKREKK